MTGWGLGRCGRGQRPWTTGGRRWAQGGLGGAFGWRHRRWATSSDRWPWPEGDRTWRWPPETERDELGNRLRDLEQELDRLRTRLAELGDAPGS
ncbi:MAG: DUF5320 domain-containing protein [Thermoanaerobaculales bacterium]|nr:DUF5320 domain-containing protein [Thermoanaerobaculales bacterium]